MQVHHSTPIWDEVRLPEYQSIRRSQEFDVVVIGGGITGLSAAYFLKEAGKRVCLIEKNRLGSGDTSHTTAHLTYVTDTRLTELVKRFGKDAAGLTWYGGWEALNLIEEIVRKNQLSCDFRRCPGFLHASLDTDADESKDLEQEAELAQELGFDAKFVETVPVVKRPGIRFSDQAKIHPMAYLAGLARSIHGEGTVIYENCEATEVESDPLAVIANGIRIPCQYVVLATGTPLMGKTGLLAATVFQTKLAAYSTYVLGGTQPAGTTPDLSLWDTSDPYYYLRTDRALGFDRVIFGGKDHKTGQEPDNEKCYADLEKVLLKYLPETKIDHRWSGQIIVPFDGLPFIGEMSEKQFVATGFNGNGITFGTLAGRMARDAALGQKNAWQDLFSVNRLPITKGVWTYLKENTDFPFYLIADRIAAKTLSVDDLQFGDGGYVSIDGKRVACSRDEHGQLHQVSPVCTHLGCLVRWNQAEKTWDCPCHGSRFKPTGEVLAGPAEKPLEKIT